MTDTSGTSPRPVARLTRTRRIGGGWVGLIVLALWGAAWFASMTGLLISLCANSDTPCRKPDWPLWAGLGVGLLMVLASGPVAWSLGGRRWYLFGVPLLVVPTWALLYVVAR